VRLSLCFFNCPSTGTRYYDLRYPLEQGREVAGLPWVGFHDLRHFRATQWVKEGVDLRTVQVLMGHQSIATTMRYAHFAPPDATHSIIEAQRREAAKWERATSGQQPRIPASSNDREILVSPSV
jgi:integrase